MRKKEKRKNLIFNLISGFAFLASIAAIGVVGYSLIDKYVENKELSQIRKNIKEEKDFDDLLTEQDYKNIENDSSDSTIIVIEFPQK